VSIITDIAEASTSVAVMDIETASTTTQTAFVVNQAGTGDVADFKSGDVSIMNVSSAGKVVIVGELEVDGRIMVCSSGACSSRLDEKVDDTLGDLGVEGKVVAGAYEGYCEEGFAWVPGSAKYGTLPGFCLQARSARLIADGSEAEMNLTNIADENYPVWTGISQGEADLRCQSLGQGYHLMSDPEWMTIAENIVRAEANDINKDLEGLQLATSTIANTYELETNNNESRIASSTGYALSNGNEIYDLTGMGEWTNQTVTAAGNIQPEADEWLEYGLVSDYKGLNIAPPYYLSSDNGIGRIKTGLADSGKGIRGFMRGFDGIYSLDLSYAPNETPEGAGFRCAK
jgi:hypothetical protein